LHTLLLIEVQKATTRLGLAEDGPAVCCYEAERDGFWIHRFLTHAGVENTVPARRAELTMKAAACDACELGSVDARWPRHQRGVAVNGFVVRRGASR
jgi:hypothetical protein